MSTFTKSTCHVQTPRILINPPRFGRIQFWLPRFGFGLMAAGITSCSTLVKSIDHKQKDWENAYLWRQVKTHPAVFYPRPLPHDAVVSQRTGNWIVDPQDQAAFFIPNEKCGELHSEVWRTEAIKGINRYDKIHQNRVNAHTVLIGWPAYTALYLTAAAAEAALLMASSFH